MAEPAEDNGNNEPQIVSALNNPVELSRRIIKGEFTPEEAYEHLEVINKQLGHHSPP